MRNCSNGLSFLDLMTEIRFHVAVCSVAGSKGDRDVFCSVFDTDTSDDSLHVLLIGKLVCVAQLMSSQFLVDMEAGPYHT